MSALAGSSGLNLVQDGERLLAKLTSVAERSALDPDGLKALLDDAGFGKWAVSATATATLLERYADPSADFEIELAKSSDAGFSLEVADDAMRATSAPGAEWSHLAGLVATRRPRGLLHEIASELAATRARLGYEAFRPFDILAVLATETPEHALSLVNRSQTTARRDWTWCFTIGGWAEVATALGAPDPAQIYDELAPFAGDIAIAGSGLDGGGPVDGLLAGLAERLGRHEAARRHARSSLQLEQRLGIRAWEPRSRAILERLGD